MGLGASFQSPCFVKSRIEKELRLPLGLGFRAYNLGFRVYGSGFRVQGLGFWVLGLEPFLTSLRLPLVRVLVMSSRPQGFRV